MTNDKTNADVIKTNNKTNKDDNDEIKNRHVKETNVSESMNVSSGDPDVTKTTTTTTTVTTTTAKDDDGKATSNGDKTSTESSSDSNEIHHELRHAINTDEQIEKNNNDTDEANDNSDKSNTASYNKENENGENDIKESRHELKHTINIDEANNDNNNSKNDTSDEKDNQHEVKQRIRTDEANDNSSNSDKKENHRGGGSRTASYNKENKNSENDIKDEKNKEQYKSDVDSQNAQHATKTQNNGSVSTHEGGLVKSQSFAEKYYSNASSSSSDDLDNVFEDLAPGDEIDTNKKEAVHAKPSHENTEELQDSPKHKRRSDDSKAVFETVRIERKGEPIRLSVRPKKNPEGELYIFRNVTYDKRAKYFKSVRNTSKMNKKNKKHKHTTANQSSKTLLIPHSDKTLLTPHKNKPSRLVQRETINTIPTSHRFYKLLTSEDSKEIVKPKDRPDLFIGDTKPHGGQVRITVHVSFKIRRTSHKRKCFFEAIFLLFLVLYFCLKATLQHQRIRASSKCETKGAI